MATKLLKQVLKSSTIANLLPSESAAPALFVFGGVSQACLSCYPSQVAVSDTWPWPVSTLLFSSSTLPMWQLPPTWSMKSLTVKQICNIACWTSISGILEVLRQIYTLFSLLPDIFLLPVRGCCALTDYLPEACRGQIIFRAQQPRTGNWKICLEVMKNKVYCHSRNERKLYARKPVVITIICPELPGV